MAKTTILWAAAACAVAMFLFFPVQVWAQQPAWAVAPGPVYPVLSGGGVTTGVWTVPSVYTPAPVQPTAWDEPTVAPAEGGSCEGGSCEAECESCGSEECCPNYCCTPKWRFFGQYLHMRPSNAPVEYGVAIDGTIAPDSVPVQIGPVGIVDPDYDPGFRVGFARRLDDCTELGITYTFLETQTTDQISTTAPNVIRSMVSHPSTASASTDFLSANSRYDVDFDLIDLDWRHRFYCNEQVVLNCLAGVRYAHLAQDFGAQFQDNGTETVESEVKFDGGGLRVGVDGEWHSTHHGLMVYGRGTANFVAGKFRGRYFQGQSFDPTVVNTSWKSDQLVSILELELGIGWTSCNDRFRATAGYLISGWQDAVLVGDYINGVQSNNYRDLGDTLVFDGFVVGAELRY